MRPSDFGRAFAFHDGMTTTSIDDLSTSLAQIADRLGRALADAHDDAALDDVRIAFLGRSGEVTAVRRTIGALAPGDRPAAGKVINDAVEAMEAQLAEARERIERDALARALDERIDVTLPGPAPAVGFIHPLRRTALEIARFFQRRGFAVVDGPEIETDAMNFDALNFPPDHPASDAHDSFYLRPDLLLRTHTSPVQVRAMREHPAPIAIIAPGRCYRRDAVDARHLYAFHQVEALMVGEGIHFGHLKGIFLALVRELFGADTEVRFRPSFFPFTEPSAELDVSCPACKGAGGACSTCSGSGWIELAGSGMVHPNVLRGAGYDVERVTGWAFGMGIERVAMKRYGIDDIRAFVENAPGFAEALA